MTPSGESCILRSGPKGPLRVPPSHTLKNRLTPSAALLALVVVIGACVAAGAVQAASSARSGAPQLIKGLVVPKFQDVTRQAGVATTVPDASCGDFVTGAAIPVDGGYSSQG